MSQDHENGAHLPTRTVFDTADYPLPKGVSERDVTGRQLLYETEDFCLDVHHEYTPGTNRASLTGQLADRKDPLKPLAGVPMRLESKGRLLAEAVSDRLGEFYMEYEQHRWMTLHVEVHEGRVIRVAIDRRTRRRPHGGAPPERASESESRGG